MLQRDYYQWRATLRDGSTIDQSCGCSLFRPEMRDVVKFELIPEPGSAVLPLTVFVPDGCSLIWFKTRRGVSGFEPNKHFPGLWYIVTSNSIQKQAAIIAGDKGIAAGEEFLATLAGKPIGDQVLAQCSNGCVATLDELLAIDIYCAGWVRWAGDDTIGEKCLQYIAPTGEIEVTDGSEISVGEHCAIETLNITKPEIKERVYNQGVQVYRERLLSKIALAKAEIASFETVLNNL